MNGTTPDSAHRLGSVAAGPAAAEGTAGRIEQLLREQLQPLELRIRDESAAHAGHAGAEGKGHFRLRIVSRSFIGRTPLQRHRQIHAALAPLWEHEVHALALEALTPDEASGPAKTR